MRAALSGLHVLEIAGLYARFGIMGAWCQRDRPGRRSERWAGTRCHAGRVIPN